MTWRAANSLLVLQQQLQRAAPASAPIRSGTPGRVQASAWGLVGDGEHDPTSDHTPHDFPGWGKQIVTAGDFPNVPQLGLDAHRVLDDIRRSHDPRAKYGISNGEIFSNHGVRQGGVDYDAWQWRPYRTASGAKPADMHFEHGHLSVIGNATADGTQPWATIGGPAAAQEDEDDMGASFGPIEIRQTGTTSLTLPPVQAGVADPREAWLNLCNDTDGKPYSLRVWITTGNGGYSPLAGQGWVNGEKTLQGGVRESVQLPKDTAGLAVSRTATAPNTGHLTLAIERGPVKA